MSNFAQTQALYLGNLNKITSVINYIYFVVVPSKILGKMLLLFICIVRALV